MTASDTPPPLTDEELAHARRRQSDPLAQTSLIEARLLAEVDRLRAALATVSDESGVQCREAAARTVRAEKERDGARAELADWMHATAEARGERDDLAAKLAAVQKVIEPSDWKPLSERHPEYFKPVSPEEAARKKGWKQGVDLLTQRIRAALGETGGTER